MDLRPGWSEPLENLRAVEVAMKRKKGREAKKRQEQKSAGTPSMKDPWDFWKRLSHFIIQERQWREEHHRLHKHPEIPRYFVWGMAIWNIPEQRCPCYTFGAQMTDFYDFFFIFRCENPTNCLTWKVFPGFLRLYKSISPMATKPGRFNQPVFRVCKVRVSFWEVNETSPS